MNTTQYLRQISETVVKDVYKGQKTTGMDDGGVFRDMMVQMAAEKSHVGPDAGKRAQGSVSDAEADGDRSKNGADSLNGADGFFGVGGHSLLRLMSADSGTAQLVGQLSANAHKTENVGTIGVSLPVTVEETGETADISSAFISRNSDSWKSFTDISQIMASIGEHPADVSANVRADNEKYIVKNDKVNVILSDAKAYTVRQELANTVVNDLKRATATAVVQTEQTASLALKPESSEINSVSGNVNYVITDRAQVFGLRLPANPTGPSGDQLRTTAVDITSGTEQRAANHVTASETSSTPIAEVKATDNALLASGFGERNRFTMDEAGIRDIEQTEKARTSMMEPPIKQGGGIGESLTKPQGIKTEFYAQIAQVIANKQGEGVKVFSVMLEPADLGRIDVNLKQFHGKMIISIAAECAKTQELLAQQAPRLISMLGMNSLHVESVQIFGQETQLTDEGYQQPFNLNQTQRENDDSNDFEREGEYKGRGAGLEGDMVDVNESESYYEGLMDLKA